MERVRVPDRRYSPGNMNTRLFVLSIFTLSAHAVAPQAAPRLLAADSVAAVRGAVRAALMSRADARPICIAFIADSLGTAAGRAFVAEGQELAGSMRRGGDSAASLGVTLVALSGRDTAHVVLRLDGDDGGRAKTSWMNRIGYDFIRGTATNDWRLIATRALYFGDYVRDDSSRVPRRSCINGSR
jgi:hypothetical protein